MDSSGSPSPSDAPNPPRDAPDASANTETDSNSSFEKWLVRFFLLMAFGVAFGIEGMTLFRSYVLDRDSGQDAATVEAAAPELPLLQVGDEVLPDSPPIERIEALALEARAGDTWTFRMTIALQNPTDQPYELTAFGVLTRSGSVHEEAFRVTCPPATRRGSWPRGHWPLATSPSRSSPPAAFRSHRTPPSSMPAASASRASPCRWCGSRSVSVADVHPPG